LYATAWCALRGGGAPGERMAAQARLPVSKRSTSEKTRVRPPASTHSPPTSSSCGGLPAATGSAVRLTLERAQGGETASTLTVAQDASSSRARASSASMSSSSAPFSARRCRFSSAAAVLRSVFAWPAPGAVGLSFLRLSRPLPISRDEQAMYFVEGLAGGRRRLAAGGWTRPGETWVDPRRGDLVDRSA